MRGDAQIFTAAEQLIERANKMPKFGGSPGMVPLPIFRSGLPRAASSSAANSGSYSRFSPAGADSLIGARRASRSKKRHDRRDSSSEWGLSDWRGKAADFNAPFGRIGPERFDADGL